MFAHLEKHGLMPMFRKFAASMGAIGLTAALVWAAVG